MNRILIALLLIGFGLIGMAQKVKIGKDLCDRCKMVIADKKFTATAIDKEGQIQNYDAIECLINMLKEKNEATFRHLLVADYANPGKYVDARLATYLKSNSIPSPMGAYLSAYADKAVAEKVYVEMGGELYDWEGIKTRFKDSKFGLLDHPDHHHNKPDAYAPIGVMGDHVHHKGSFMMSLRYMRMNMDGNLNEHDRISETDIHQDHMVAPNNMSMDMYMLGLMYSPTDKLTLMLMQSFLQNSMEASTRMGMEFTTKSAGFGDTKLSALYSLYATDGVSVHLNTGVSIPQGNVSMKDDTPMADDMKMPYPMQLGSGTVDLIFGATLRQAANKVSWGAQPMGTFRVHKNKEGYRQGHEMKLNVWAAFNASSWVSFSGRIEGVTLTHIYGADSDLNPMMSPAASATNSGFTKVRSYLGSNISFAKIDVLKSLKIGLEYGLPIYQKVNGIQMAEEAALVAGIRYLL